MEIGFIGLGKMGLNMVTRLQRAGHQVAAYDGAAEALKQTTATGCVGALTTALFTRFRSRQEESFAEKLCRPA